MDCDRPKRVVSRAKHPRPRVRGSWGVLLAAAFFLTSSGAEVDAHTSSVTQPTPTAAVSGFPDQYWPPYPWEQAQPPPAKPPDEFGRHEGLLLPEEWSRWLGEASPLRLASPSITISTDSSGLRWQVVSPKTYAAKVCTITVICNETVVVAVSETKGDLLSDAGSTMPLWYSFGDTLDQAEAFGWIRSADVQGMTFPGLFGGPAPTGKSVTVWCKIEAKSAKADSSYRASLALNLYVEP